MSESKKAARIDLGEFKDLMILRDTREEVLREIGLQKGKQKARQEIAKNLLDISEPPEKVASLTGLTLEEIQKLQ